VTISTDPEECREIAAISALDRLELKLKLNNSDPASHLLCVGLPTKASKWKQKKAEHMFMYQLAACQRKASGGCKSSS
jgi:hypothetical protein